MNGAQLATFRAAVDLLVSAARQRANPEDPAAYTRVVARDLRGTHYEHACDILEANPDMDAQTLAERLGSGERDRVEAPNTSAALPTVASERWEPHPDPEHAKAKLAEARARLEHRK